MNILPNLQATCISEPLLMFGYNQMMEHPKDGLLMYGPYKKVSSIKIGIIGTNDGLARYRKWAEKIRKPISPKTSNHPNHMIFPGFEAVFQTAWPEPQACIIVNEIELLNAIRITDRHQAIYKSASIYADKITQYNREMSESTIELWIAIIPEEVYRLGRPKSKVPRNEASKPDFSMNKKVATRLLKEPSLFDEDNEAAEIYLYELNFHNQLKARLLAQKISIQVIRETTLCPDDFLKSNGIPIRQLQDPATLAWNLSTTLFFKCGGQPWKLASTRPGVCYVGVVFKREIMGADEANACCGAQMFLDSGDGVVFRGAVGPWYSPTNKQFHLSKDKAHELMSIIISAYKAQNNGEYPRELFIHGKTSFSEDEYEGFSLAVPTTCKVVCVRIKLDFTLKAFRPGKMNIPRGMAFKLNDYKGFVWTRGFIPRLQTYAGREVPNPLSVEIVKGQAEAEIVMNDILCLTKLNYNTCIYGDGQPVTLRFADVVGEILTSGPIKDDLPPLPFRYYI